VSLSCGPLGSASLVGHALVMMPMLWHLLVVPMRQPHVDTRACFPATRWATPVRTIPSSLSCFKSSLTNPSCSPDQKSGVAISSRAPHLIYPNQPLSFAITKEPRRVVFQSAGKMESLPPPWYHTCVASPRLVYSRKSSPWHKEAMLIASTTGG
jgi:hypothetical protein